MLTQPTRVGMQNGSSVEMFTLLMALTDKMADQILLQIAGGGGGRVADISELS